MRPRWVIGALLLLALPAWEGCAEDAVLSAPRMDGLWGGDHVRLEIDEEGGRLEYDCAFGELNLPERIEEDGSFSVTGTHTFESGGPVRSDDIADEHPARYDGQLLVDSMILTVTLTDSGQVLGPYALTKGSPGRLYRCL